ncbi:hypothetical protein [Desulfosarcina sp.]|uniref:hypothetical protein n=1 Tax=Desulfosarcina sp. TaxID=2027861 RepID=UPI0039705D4F
MSLGTGSLKTARIRAAKLTSHTKLFLDMITEGRIVISRKSEIKAALGQYLREILEKHEMGRLEGSDATPKPNSPGVDVDSETMLTIVELEILNQLKGRQGSGKLDVAGFLDQVGLKDMSEDSPTYRFVHRELLKLCQAVIKIEQERMKGNYNSQLELSILSNYPAQQPLVPASEAKQKRKRSKRLSKAIQQFLNESVSDDKWAPKSITEYKNRLALLPEIMGDCLLSEIDFSKTRKFFDDLKRLPPNRSKMKAYRGVTIPELLKMKLPPVAYSAA